MKAQDLKLQSLWYFMDVAETRNFSKSAENNFTSQSNVSYAIRSLEKYLGVPLFIRRENDIILSKYGERLLPYVRDVFTTLDKGCEALEEMINPITGDVWIGYSSIYSRSFVPDLFRWIYDGCAEKGLKVQLRSSLAHTNENIARVEDYLVSGDCDLALTCLQTRENCNFVKLAPVEHAVLMAKDHPLAKSESVTLQQLREEPFMLLEGDLHDLNYYGRMFEYFGIEPNLIAPGISWTAIFVQVAAGRCMTIAPTGRYDDFDIVAVPLVHPMKMRDIYLATPTNRKLSNTVNFIKQQILDYFGV